MKNDNHDYRLYNPRKEQELADQARLAEEKRKADEAARLAEEKRKADEAARLAEEKRKAEEAARLVEEKRKADEAARLAEEQRKADEATRLAEEKRKAEEAIRLAEEKRKADEAVRLAEEQRKAEELVRLAAEQRKAEEAVGLTTEKRKAEESVSLAEEKHKTEEVVRLEEEKRQNEQPKQKEVISRYSNSALSELSATINSALLAQEQLNKQLMSDNSSSVWANTLDSSRRYDSDEFRAYKQKTNLNQLGVQKVDDNYRVGLLLSHSKANNTFAENISSKNRLTMLSAFGRYHFSNGLNVSADAGYGISAGEIRGELQDGKMKRHVMVFGVGLGYEMNLDRLAIKPNVGVHRYHISSETYQYDQAQVYAPAVNFNAYHAGVIVDYSFTPWQGVTVRPSFGINYVDASDSKLAVHVNQIPLTQRLDRYWQQEIGLSADFGSWQVSTYASQSRGKQLDKQRQLSFKVGYLW